MTELSTLGDRPPRADARRNERRILDAAAELTAGDPTVSLEQIAARAGVSRATLYHRFAGREALLDALTERSVHEVSAAVQAARPEEETAGAAMERVLLGAWEVVGRYRGLVIVNRRLPAAELRARLEPALAPVRSLIRRGQCSGEFDPELSADWLLVLLTDIIHAASALVSAGALAPGDARRALLRSALGVLASHRLQHPSSRLKASGDRADDPPDKG